MNGLSGRGENAENRWAGFARKEGAVQGKVDECNMLIRKQI
jgi:hypothetical protein